MGTVPAKAPEQEEDLWKEREEARALEHSPGQRSSGCGWAGVKSLAGAQRSWSVVHVLTLSALCGDMAGRE